MARYLAKEKTWLSHECRMIEAGQEFDAEFPKDMKLGNNLEMVKPKKAAKEEDKGAEGAQP